MARVRLHNALLYYINEEFVDGITNGVFAVVWYIVGYSVFIDFGWYALIFIGYSLTYLIASLMSLYYYRTFVKVLNKNFEEMFTTSPTI